MLYLPLIDPATITMPTVNKLSTVNMLFSTVDSLTPNASKPKTKQKFHLFKYLPRVVKTVIKDFSLHLSYV